MCEIAFTTARTKNWHDRDFGTVVTQDANNTRVYVCNVVCPTKDGRNKTEFWEKSMKTATGRENSLRKQICNFKDCGNAADVGVNVRVFKGPRSGKIAGWFVMPTCFSCNKKRSLDCRCDENSSNDDCCKPGCKNEKHELSMNYKLVFRLWTN